MATTVGRTALVTVDLILAQGADNPFAFVYSRTVGEVTTPVDLTSWTAASQIRRSIGGEVWLEVGPLVTLTAQGGISFVITAATTSDPAWNDRRTGVWDLELTDGNGAVVRFAEGAVRLSGDVTRNVI